MVDLLPREASALVSIIYPFASIATLGIASHLGSGQSTALGEERSAPPHSQNVRLLRTLALTVIFLEVLCGAFLRSVYSRGGINYSPEVNTIATYLISFSIGVVLLLIARRANSAADCALAIGSVGLIVFALVSFVINVVPLSALIPCITGLYSALIVFMMALIQLWHDDGDREPLACAGAFLTLYGIASATTASLIPALLSYRGRMPNEHVASVVAAAGIAITLGIAIALLAMLFAQRKTTGSATRSSGFEENESSFNNDQPAIVTDSIHEQAVREIAKRYGLTERERQTASLVAKGYTAKRVADSMTVALSTIQGYNKSIYRKMGIHRKDELIEEVRRTERELERLNQE